MYIKGTHIARIDEIVRIDASYYPGDVIVTVEDHGGRFAMAVTRADLASILFPRED